MSRDLCEMGLDEFLDYLTPKLSPITIHNKFSESFRRNVDNALGDKLSISQKKFLFYTSLSTLLNLSCLALHYANHSTSTVILAGGLMGAILQGAPHCKDQKDLERKYPITSMLTGVFHGTICAASCYVFKASIGSAIPHRIANVAFHAGAMAIGMCFVENKVLKYMDSLYGKSPESKKINHCCCK